MGNKTLIIVESPTKIKTLKKFLGSQYILESSVGHIRDLPEKEFGIDIEGDFEPKYVTMPDKEKVIQNLQRAAEKCQTVYLSPDPDREGEAIAWHIYHLLPKDIEIKRVTFNSITKSAVEQAIAEPREIDMALVNAQQARRLLDRIVGYKISPILNRRIQRGKQGFVSAGRVQSVALKLVVDREKEIEAFVPVEYWNIAALLQPDNDERSVKAALYSVDGKRVEKEAVAGKELCLIGNKETADQILARMKKSPYTVLTVERKEKRRNPVPPFITSTLQQEASRHYGFSSARTMNIAQSLYEGVDLGNEGSEGLITYMRTDSVRAAPEAVAEARKYIEQKYGKNYLPTSPNSYSTKKSAQDAHEAIRPTNLAHPPEMIQSHLSREQFMLYLLIWRRFIASQMLPAIYDTISADIDAGSGIIVRATGATLKFQGFLALYEEKEDEEDKGDESHKLPPLEPNQKLALVELTSDQAFTRPPPRFSEASLVKELEKSGIGRPSTYASIMNKIQGRDYTVKEKGRLKPTELGRVIAQMLETNFQTIMNVGFTAQMEDDLELVAQSERDWKELIRNFWRDFAPVLETAEKEAFVPKIDTDIPCPKCQAHLQKIWYRNKYFYGCSKYPDCDFRAPQEELFFNRADYAENFNWEQPCPKCGSTMKVRHGRYGAFLGCTAYPECKGLVNIPKKGEVPLDNSNMPPCPAISCSGQMVARRSRFGKTFYSCSTYPECDVIVNDLEQLQTKYVDHPRTPYVKKKKEKGGAEKKGKTAAKTVAKKAKKSEVKDKKVKGEKTEKKERNVTPVPVSAELAALLGKSESTLQETVKLTWEYIKAHNLQDPSDKRMIRPDALLSKVFGSADPINMFQMTKKLSEHIRRG